MEEYEKSLPLSTNRISFNSKRIIMSESKEKKNDKFPIFCHGCKAFPLSARICPKCEYISCIDCLQFPGYQNICTNDDCRNIIKEEQDLKYKDYLRKARSIKIICDFKEEGCEEVLSPLEYLSHINECPYINQIHHEEIKEYIPEIGMYNMNTDLIEEYD